MKSEKERISLSLCNIWNSFSCWADDKTRGLCRGSVLFILITVLFVTTEKRDGAALRQFLHPVTGARGASSELITDGIRGWVQNLQLCYEHKKYASISTENLQERNRCLCPFSKFPSGLCNNLENFFIYFHPVHFSSGDKSQRANLFILIDAVPWIFIGGENPLAQPVVAHCQQTQSCSGIEGGQ